MLKTNVTTAEKSSERFTEIMEEYQENTAHPFLKITSLTPLIHRPPHRFIPKRSIRPSLRKTAATRTTFTDLFSC
jgi:hypothetical protein